MDVYARFEYPSFPTAINSNSSFNHLVNVLHVRDPGRRVQIFSPPPSEGRDNNFHVPDGRIKSTNGVRCNCDWTRGPAEKSSLVLRVRCDRC